MFFGGGWLVFKGWLWRGASSRTLVWSVLTFSLEIVLLRGTGSHFVSKLSSRVGHPWILGSKRSSRAKRSHIFFSRSSRAQRCYLLSRNRALAAFSCSAVGFLASCRFSLNLNPKPYLVAPTIWGGTPKIDTQLLFFLHTKKVPCNVGNHNPESLISKPSISPHSPIRPLKPIEVTTKLGKPLSISEQSFNPKPQTPSPKLLTLKPEP